MNTLSIYKIPLTYMTVCFTMGLCIGKYYKEIFNTKILLKPYLYQIRRLIKSNDSGIVELFKKLRQQLGNTQFKSLCETIVDDLDIYDLKHLLKGVDKDTFNIVFSIMLTRIKNDD